MGQAQETPDDNSSDIFVKGIQKLCETDQLNVSMDIKTQQLLASHLNRALRTIVKNALQGTSEKEKLLPGHIKNALNNVMEGGMLKIATSEGARCLSLSKYGAIKFKPKVSGSSKPKERKMAGKAKRTSKVTAKVKQSSKVSKRPNGTSRKLNGAIFSEGLKGFFSEIREAKAMDDQMRQRVESILADTADHLATRAAKLCRDRKRPYMTNLDIAEALKSVVSDNQLRRHALSQGAGYVIKYAYGRLKYREQPSLKKGVSKPARREVSKEKPRRTKTVSKKRRPSVKKKLPSPKTPKKDRALVRKKKVPSPIRKSTVSPKWKTTARRTKPEKVVKRPKRSPEKKAIAKPKKVLSIKKKISVRKAKPKRKSIQKKTIMEPKWVKPKRIKVLKVKRKLALRKIKPQKISRPRWKKVLKPRKKKIVRTKKTVKMRAPAKRKEILVKTKKKAIAPRRKTPKKTLKVKAPSKRKTPIKRPKRKAIVRRKKTPRKKPKVKTPSRIKTPIKRSKKKSYSSSKENPKEKTKKYLSRTVLCCTGIATSEALRKISSVVSDVCLLLVAESAGDAKTRGHKELGAENVRNATNIVFSQQMALHAVARGGNVIMNNANDII
ncbi:hypothetical protein CDAR_597361 [Caerostris darwini]|uniref:Histone H1 n=1 Tax=Caerostris darwini TaxID=1538125 RepID=A0AAV4VPW5_9ARAC|nr:hypothetical protein CDAR_597361 [Caerostris darwini]